MPPPPAARPGGSGPKEIVREEAVEQPNVDALARRIERMEHQIRRWKTLGIAAVAALGLVALLAGPDGRDAKAEEAKEYNITLPPEIFRGAAAQSAGEIRTRRVILVDKEGKARGRLQVSETGTPSLELFGPGAQTQAALAVKGSGSPRLVLYDKLGRVLWRAP